MSLPGNTLSMVPVLGSFLGAQRLPNSDFIDYEDGPIHLQDPSAGAQFQIWRIRYVNDTIYLGAPNTPEHPIFVKRCLTTVNLAFDQNGRYVLIYLFNSELHIYWYDTTVARYADIILDTGVTSARITLDDKRKWQLANSQLILGYTKNNNLYLRQQSDRFMVAYLMQRDIGGPLLRIGLTRHYRFQFLLGAHPVDTYVATMPWGDL